MEYLSNAIEKFKGASILCIGDLMLDLFVYGEVSRISPEAPIPILHVQRQFYALGGAGNVINNILSLGATPYVIGVIGDDLNGQNLLSLFKEKHVECNGIIKNVHTQTIIKNRFSARDQQLLRVDYENLGNFDTQVYDLILQKATTYLPKVQALVLSDYGKGVLEAEKVIKPLIKMARALCIPVIVDPKGSDYSIYEGCTLVTPNKKELKEATQMSTHSNEEIAKAAAWLIRHTGIQNVLATRSEEGMTLVEQSGKIHHFPTIPREVYDVSGAGDTVVATLSVALASHLPIKEAVHLANLAGTIVVGKVGTATVSAQELIESLHEEELILERQKIMNLSKALDQVKKWRRKNLKVGFTNGCFDLLHLGHLASLKKARQACDKLIVAINTDFSVQKAKGPERPIQSEVTRSMIISSLECVDLVILFSEETPYDLIKTLEPDVLVKGADYSIDKIAGADIVIQRGGKVILIDLEEGFSTTNTVKKIQSVQ